MTKEQILDKNCGARYGFNKSVENARIYTRKDILRAMEEYAQKLVKESDSLPCVKLSSLTDEMLDKWIGEADLCELGAYAEGREHGAAWLADKIRAFRDKA